MTSTINTVPLTDTDQHTFAVANWLRKEGYTPAADVLTAMTTRGEAIDLGDLKTSDSARLGALLIASLKGECFCRIWSDEHRAYWRAGGNGYTQTVLEAGLFTFGDAWERTSHCGPEKGIVYEILVTVPTRPRQSGWKS